MDFRGEPAFCASQCAGDRNLWDELIQQIGSRFHEIFRGFYQSPARPESPLRFVKDAPKNGARLTGARKASRRLGGKETQKWCG
jgi:hypothetical protein